MTREPPRTPTDARAERTAPPGRHVERTAAPGRYVVIYDGECPLCRSGIGKLLALARRGAVEAVSLHDPAVPSRFPGLSPEALRAAMHLVLPDGRVLRGFEAAVRAVATRPLPGWLAYLYYLPGLRFLLDRAYAFVARNRHRLSGSSSCVEGACGAHRGGAHGERVDGERVDGERVDGERVDGERVHGEGVDGERVHGEGDHGEGAPGDPPRGSGDAPDAR